MSLTDQLQDAIHSSELTLYRIAIDAGVPYAVLYRFAHGERDIKLKTADRLAEYFGMRLTRPKRKH